MPTVPIWEPDSLAVEASVTALRPAALSAAACAELIGGTLGTDPAPAFQEACRELTGGNPLLLRGLLAGLAAAGLKGTGERALRFVHPLVRSAVYSDLAPPVRQRWHKHAARLLDEQGAPAEEVTVHLLAAAATGDAWVVDRLRRAAASARARGAPDVAAAQCLERALAEPPPAGVRGDVLQHLRQARDQLTARACGRAGASGRQRVYVTP
jgi:hypothetical protein